MTLCGIRPVRGATTGKNPVSARMLSKLGIGGSMPVVSSGFVPTFGQPSLRRRRGVIAVEFLIFTTLFLILFAVLLRHLFTLWMQVRAEDQAMILAREAAVQFEPAGTVHFQSIFSGQGTAEIRWDQSNVFVRVDVQTGRAGAERLLPRESP
jgi:hypothetical protein